jgi:hypothetical protein
MNATIETHKGRTVLRVLYDPEARDWNARIQAALDAYGLTAGKVLVIAEPAKATKKGIGGALCPHWQGSSRK